MVSSTCMTYVRLLSLGLTLLLAACGDASTPKEDAPPDDGSRVLKAASMQGWLTLDAHTALARLDRNGDFAIDAADLAHFEKCIEEADAKTRPDCDLVPDGTLDALDLRLLRLLVGHTRAHPRARVASFADALDDYATESFAADMSALFDDHDGSGKSDPGDMRRVAELLRDDPVKRWDLDGDGKLGHGDLWEAERRARVSGGSDLSADVDGDGTASDADLYLLGDLVHYSSSVVTGFLDHDGNGVVNLADFCMVESDPFDGATTALRQLMPLTVAEASAAEAPPRVGTCRSDGLSYHRHPVSFGVPLSLVVLSDNLELVAVDSVPQGYMLPGGLPSGTAYVVRASDGGSMKHPLESLSLPLGGGEGGDVAPPEPQLRVGGEPLAADAQLLMPGGSASLQVSVQSEEEHSEEESTTMQVVTSQVEISLQVLETVALEQNAAGAASFQSALDAALATFEGYINGCPCTLDTQSRAEIVRSILRMEHCLAAVHAAASQALEAARKNHRSYYADTVTRSRISALAFHHLADTFVHKATVDALLLVLETSYDGLSGGLGKAAAGAIGNASSALVDSMQPSEFWGAGPGGESSVADATLQSVSKGAALGIGTSGLTSTLKDLLSKGGKHLDLPTFSKKLLDGTIKNTGKKFSPPDLEAFIKSFIKALPGLYLDYVKAHTLAVERMAGEAQAIYFESTLTVRDWQSVIAATATAQARVSQARKDLLDTMASQGCPMTITDDPCMPPLNAALEDARTSLDQEITAANADITDAMAKLGDTPEVENCFAGSAAKDRSAAELEVANISEEIIERVGEVGAEGIERELQIRLRDAQDAADQEREKWRSACVGAILSGTIDDADALSAIAQAQQRKQDALDAYTQEVDAALAAYKACSSDGGGGCGGSTTTTRTAKDAWSAAMACLECVPSVAMECCGDGVVGGSEACEPGAGTNSCGEGYVCNAECACECEGSDCGGTLPPDDLVSVGSIFGLTLDDLQSKYMPVEITTVQHTVDAVGSKAVAGDHTTITGIARFTRSLDSALLTSLFVTNHPCGPGTGSFTVCPMGVSGAPPAGSYLLLFTTYAGPVPSSSAMSHFQYGSVLDADPNSTNYQAKAPNSSDFFDGTDFWRVATYSPGGGWSLQATDASGGTPTQDSTQARMIFLGSAGVTAIPITELATSNPPQRVTAFEHDGNWGLNPGDPWNGSLFPSVLEGVLPP